MKGVEQAICLSGGWLCEVFMAELNGVVDKGGFYGGVEELEAAVVLQGGANVSPRGAGGGLVVDEYAASDGAK